MTADPMAAQPTGQVSPSEVSPSQVLPGQIQPSQVLHGGAERQPLRLVNAPAAPLVFSWYSIAPAERCTAHVHTGKAETWLIVQGQGEARVAGRVYQVTRGDALVTLPGQPHEMTNVGTEPLVFVNMVTRLDDEPVTTTELGE